MYYYIYASRPQYITNLPPKQFVDFFEDALESWEKWIFILYLVVQKKEKQLKIKRNIFNFISYVYKKKYLKC